METKLTTSQQCSLQQGRPFGLHEVEHSQQVKERGLPLCGNTVLLLSNLRDMKMHVEA